MPTGQPFTQLCQSLARPRYHGRVDLHMHSTFSDGTYTPVEIVDLARRSGLSAIAVTDHDTVAGIEPTRRAADGALEVISGVEITAEFRGRELHLLGYYFDPEYPPLVAVLADLQASRADRFNAMIERLRTLGVQLETSGNGVGPPPHPQPLSPGGERGELGPPHLQPLSPGGERGATALGRRHVAELIVKAKKASTVREAFQRYLGDHGRASVPKKRLPVAEAIALVRDAGGVASWAHPTYDCNSDALRELAEFGLGAIEVEYPSFRRGRIKELRRLAAEFGLAVSGGSDCHGPGEPHRSIGASSISHQELMRLREICCVPSPGMSAAIPGDNES